MARIVAPTLEAKLEAIRQLAKFGRAVIANLWMKDWVETKLNWPDPDHKDIYRANLLLFTHAVETLNALAVVVSAGLEIPGFGLVGPGCSLLRGQLECYWHLRLLLKEPSLVQRNCTAFMYCYNHTHYRANMGLIEVAAPQQSKPQLIKGQEEEKAKKLDKEHYGKVKLAYQQAAKGSKYPEWYELYEADFPDGKPRRPNSLRDVARILDEVDVYTTRCHYWSAVAHGTTPILGKPQANPTGKGWIEIAADIEAMAEVADAAIYQAGNTYVDFVKALMPEREVELRNFMLELTSRFPGVQFACLKQK